MVVYEYVVFFWDLRILLEEFIKVLTWLFWWGGVVGIIIVIEE